MQAGFRVFLPLPSRFWSHTGTMYEIKDTGRRAVNLQEHNVFFFSFPFDSDASEKLDRPLIFCHAMLFDKPLVLVGLDL
jgi:hypothetical protein